MTTEHKEHTEQPKRIEFIARGVLHRDGQVLLCRDRKGGYCYLPGGHVEPGESASEALARELREEAGMHDVYVGSCALIAEHRYNQKGKPRHEVNVVFHVERCTLSDGTPLSLQTTPQTDERGTAALTPIESLEDHIEFVWVEAAALGEVDLRPSAFRAWLMSGSAGLDQPGWLSWKE